MSKSVSTVPDKPADSEPKLSQGKDHETNQSQVKDNVTVQSVQPSAPPTVSISFADNVSILDDFGSKDGGEGSGSEFSSRVGDNEGSEISTVPDKYGFLGGQQYKAYPDNKKLDPRAISQLLNREKKWMEMTRNWEEYMTKHYKKVRIRCRKGIPRKVRPLAWHYLCGGQLLIAKHDTGSYDEFLSREGDPKYLADIQKDIDRQFFHEMFLSRETSSTTGGEEEKPPPGKQALVNILKAYSVVNPVVGYCQAQAPIAAFLLMHMPEEHAFWCLYSICDKYLRGYYSPGMEMIQLDGDILFNLLKKVSPHIHKLLTKQQVDPIMYMTEWFLCAFVRTLPWETLLRVWDMFLCEGVKIFFKAALVVIRMSLPCKTYAKLKKEFPTMYETLQALRHPSQQLLEEEIVVEQILNLNLSVEDFQHEHQRQTLKRKKKQQLKQNAATQHKQGNNVEPPR